MDSPAITAPTAFEVERLIDWTQPPYDAVPKEHRPAVVEYETATYGIPDAAEGATVETLRDWAADAGEGGRATPEVIARAVDAMVRRDLRTLDTWHLALDTLDSSLRGPAGLPDWAKASSGRRRSGSSPLSLASSGP
ncbi:hypothetical protein SMD11_7038 [Streptomyces albireticuli]|uniref:Uncharacterized protein n=1 Tax=Streptomyces albireticuli TaxID=1940 RepID=A0A1Z2LEA1_9ACTN|nr:hypothetical protein [Streptomyces albireticuli]ARZ72614.1 hypothetical protein SMD11_7038 [Streptomyces albireticuli]